MEAPTLTSPFDYTALAAKASAREASHNAALDTAFDGEVRVSLALMQHVASVEGARTLELAKETLDAMENPEPTRPVLRLSDGHSRRSPHRDELRTAIHEIGHTIVAHRLGVWVRWVAVGREGLEREFAPKEARTMLGCCNHGNHVERDEEEPMPPRQCTAIERATIGQAA